MTSILRNYAFTGCLVLGILAGGIFGIAFGESASIVKPVGDAFLNLMFVMVVPLVFFSISSAVYNMKQMNMIGKVLPLIVLVFVVMAVIAAIFAYLSVLVYNPFEGIDKAMFLKNLPLQSETPHLSAGELLVRTFTVPDFLLLFSKSNLLPLILFSAFLGLATAYSGKTGATVAELLNSGTAVLLRMMTVIMYAAPIGLGCYFADTVGKVGGQIVNGYLNAFGLYLFLAAIYYFGFNSIFVWLSGGKAVFKAFWRNIITPSLTAIATSSSSACIPINIEAAQKTGVPPEIAETVIPLGTNLHKDGSVMGGILKIVFLLTIFGSEAGFSGNFFFVIGVALLVGAVMGAIPSGGMTGELLICSVFGFSPQLAGTLMIISTIIDIPATLINSTGNVAGAVLVAQLSNRKK
ncbi:MAG: dicarboxylate/amino acid:cation symporter [Dysgonamonadaceae bacterium]|nr:dicarboxylate/amino acid:cation symporter [Dysgonamonadaceae bacterium]